jgi:hypothetical protein
MPTGYWKYGDHARRPVQLLSSRPNLRFEICVVFLIGRFSYAQITLP